MTAVQDFTEKTLKLLELERNEDIEETRKLWISSSAKELQKRGLCLLKLQITSMRTGLYGRTLVVMELARHFTDRKLPCHSMTSGDIIGLSLSQSHHCGDMIASGILTKVREVSVTVAFDESYDSLSLSEQDLYTITKLANDVTYKRIKKALNDMDGRHTVRSYHLMDVLFGIAPPQVTTMNQTQELTQNATFYNQSLDDSQKEAVNFAIKQKEVAVIHGPPGTGKTTTLVEIILQSVKLQMKVLACAPSNIAVDNLVEKLGDHVKIVRLGHPARISHGIHKYSLDAVLSRSDAAQIVEDVRKDIDKTQIKMLKLQDKSEKHKLRQETKQLRKELKQRENKAIREILSAADVVLATNISASLDGPLKHLKEDHFDMVIIDECAQALEASCWIPLLQVSKCILAGDHHQLPPTIISNQASKDGLSVSLMERIVNLHGDSVVKMLTVQYRMHNAIMTWASHQLYQNKLTAHPSVANHLLRDLPDVEDTEVTSVPLLLIDTAGCDLYELDLEDEMSKANEGEVDLVEVHVDALVCAGVKASDIAVIAPYNLQVDMLKMRLSGKYANLEIKSVDGFQGREKEAVVITMVRSNPKGIVGFLSENRRMNVAVTRARRHLAVICDSETVSHDHFLKSLTDYMTDNGEVHTAFQYIQNGLIGNHGPETQYLQRGGSHGPDTQYLQSSGKQTIKQKATRHDAKETTKTKIVKSRGFLNETHKSEASDPELPIIEKQIEDFICDFEQLEFTFPHTLTSHQRYLVHQAAEQRGLSHYSQGDGVERCITVSKIKHKTLDSDLKSTKNEDKNTDSRITDNDGNDEAECENEEDDEITVTTVTKTMATELDKETDSAVCPEDYFRCTICKKIIPSLNRLLHEINCEFQNKVKTNVTQDSAKSKDKKKRKKKAIPENAQNDDIDKLLEQVTKRDYLCNSSGCKESTRTFGQTCEFCKKMYCFSHHMAEVHGCGVQAKQSARRRAQGNAMKTSKDKPLDPAARANLQRKMDKKMNEFADKRRPKPSKK
ncbi:LOW QUALITY PROTEIN: DNA-binding protein SMUBP-2-like [Ptychodera flava]|uniref:LOW QUALITY PROTEIN: DNA-binding protein SMUBP-2-like n=1 Tax=Ptychodera flava TaxID=63121 RepID=UPI00396A35F9